MLYLGNYLYKDSNNTLLLKVKNRPLLSPSAHTRTIEDSIFLKEVFNPEDSSYYPLYKVIDTGTFKMVNIDGCYFKDTMHVFIYIMKPVPVQFYMVRCSEIKFIGYNKNFAVYKSGVLYNGILLHAINPANLSILNIISEDNSGYYDFITDGYSLFNREYPMTKDDLEYYKLSEKDRKTLMKYLNNSN